MFQVDADSFSIRLPNGFTLTFTPADENGKEHYRLPNFDENHPQFYPKLRMNVGGNGTNVTHTVFDAGELALHIQSFSKLPKP